MHGSISLLTPHHCVHFISIYMLKDPIVPYTSAVALISSRHCAFTQRGLPYTWDDKEWNRTTSNFIISSSQEVVFHVPNLIQCWSIFIRRYSRLKFSQTQVQRRNICNSLDTDSNDYKLITTHSSHFFFRVYNGTDPNFVNIVRHNLKVSCWRHVKKKWFLRYL